jgi:heme A synthase
MRSLHPLLAVCAALYLLGAASYLKSLSPRAAFPGGAVMMTILSQLVLGVANIWLSAPGWMQVLHLAVANVVWIFWVLLGAELLSARRPEAATA